MPAAVVAEKIDVYPEINRFGKTLPAYGVFLRHARGVMLQNITLTLDSPTIARVRRRGCRAAPTDPLDHPRHRPGASLIRLTDVRNANLARFELDGARPATFLRIEGKTSARINAEAALPQSATIKVVDFGAEANSSSLTH
jgi:hypothetical protein